jgi:hypothetical protein
VGEATGASGVRVGANNRGVDVKIGSSGVGVPSLMLSAATVCATAVCMPLVSCVLSGVAPLPQAVRSKEETAIEVNSIYLIFLNIFFLSR